MPEAIELYLDRVMRHASLTSSEARRVRGELKEHLYELAADRGIDPKNTKEILVMLEKEFGNPGELGSSIAKSKGRFATYLKKKARRVPIAIAVIVLLVLGLRATVAQAFKVTGDGVSPILTKGSRCLVYKHPSSFAPDEIIVYRPAENPGASYLAIVKAVEANGSLSISRNKTGTFTIDRSAVVGKVFLNTR